MNSILTRSILVLLIVSSFIFSQSVHFSFGAEGTSSTCSDSSITGLSASGNNQNFIPKNVIDNNFNTLWSNYGKGSWIQLDLGASKDICNVNIAWYKGNQRQNNFVISTSSDGNSFKNVLDSKSKGDTLSFEKYSLSNVNARYVKITVNGNTQNNYASITEVKIQTSGQQQTQCSTASVKGSKASGSQTSFPPSNVLDKNLDTRWSNNGKGSWIQLDLGASKDICDVNIAWYKGNERQNNFVISTSKDGNTFTSQSQMKSSGSTLDFEKYSLSNINARYVKITVNGNTQNDYASITEIKVSTQDSIPTQPPSTGGDDTTGGGGTGSDGVKMIYPTASNGQTWFFNPTNPDDGQFDRNGAQISKNSDGSWHLQPGTTRMLAFTKDSGLPSDEVRSTLPTYDYSKLPQIGYWYKPTDWKNLEITMYVKVTGNSGGGNEISLVSRSVRHSTNVHEGCGGSSYHNNIDFTSGQFKYKKEMWHVNYDIKPFSGINIGSTMNKWVGFKGIVYNQHDGSIKLESYVDKDNNNKWQKAEEMVDKGDWGNDMTHCNAKTPGALINWASPMVIYKSNGVAYDFKKLSVREIVPPS